jgi:hypothetical protein
LVGSGNYDISYQRDENNINITQEYVQDSTSTIDYINPEFTDSVTNSHGEGISVIDLTIDALTGLNLYQKVVSSSVTNGTPANSTSEIYYTLEPVSKSVILKLPQLSNC